ncbi:MAG: IS1/IS1595 family N-terminal zinc-binding domain-containing protein [Pyrinomonadaceae bacterium]
MHCGSDQLARHGFTHKGKPRDLCSACGRRRRDHPQPNGDTPQARQPRRRAAHERRC